MHETANTKRIGRGALRPPNASLSVRDVHLLIREVDNYLSRIRGARGREVAMNRRHAQKLIDKLRQVIW